MNAAPPIDFYDSYLDRKDEIVFGHLFSILFLGKFMIPINIYEVNEA